MKQNRNCNRSLQRPENQVMVIPAGKDKQGRTVAEVMVYGQGEAEISFQEELLKSGLART
ncbi:MAG: thermonuclease family protein [Nostoc sp.]|uniref:thermonuclease family protein n=1 Tax=Nostoc sp. TaxID=1180 RepID=UPI002FF5FC13